MNKTYPSQHTDKLFIHREQLLTTVWTAAQYHYCAPCPTEAGSPPAATHTVGAVHLYWKLMNQRRRCLHSMTRWLCLMTLCTRKLSQERHICSDINKSVTSEINTNK